MTCAQRCCSLLASGQADTILVNSKFTARVFKEHFCSIRTIPRVVYPGINLDAYKPVNVDASGSDITSILSYVVC